MGTPKYKFDVSSNYKLETAKHTKFHGTDGRITVLGYTPLFWTTPIEVFLELGTLQTTQINPNQSLVVRNPWFGVLIWTNIRIYSHYTPHQHPMFAWLSSYDFHMNPACSICEGGSTWISDPFPSGFLFVRSSFPLWISSQHDRPKRGTLTMNWGRQCYHNHSHPTLTSKITETIPLFWHLKHFEARCLAIPLSWGYGKSKNPAARSMPYMAPAMMGAMAGCMGGANKHPWEVVDMCNRVKWIWLAECIT